MARRITSVVVERRLITVPVAGVLGCITDQEDCCAGSGSGSGSGPGDECILECDVCAGGMSAVWELAVSGYDTITLNHDEDYDDGNYCRFVSDDLVWSLYYDYGDALWLLVNYDTGEAWFIPGNEWACLGENVLLASDGVSDSAVVTPVYGCGEISYNCVDGACESVAGTGGTYATLAECQEECGGGLVETPCCPDNPLPATLYATFSGSLSTLGTVPLIWNGSVVAPIWEATVEACDGTVGISFSCLITDFAVTLTGDASGTKTNPVNDCEPLLWSSGAFTVSGPGSCNGEASLVVTATP